MERILDLQVKVSDEQIEDIMSSALTGCTFWADEVRLKRRSGRTEKTDPEYFSTAITHGCNLLIHDVDANKWRELTITKFLKGLSLSPRFDYDNYDSLDADSVLQTALFGEVIYG